MCNCLLASIMLLASMMLCHNGLYSNAIHDAYFFASSYILQHFDHSTVKI